MSGPAKVVAVYAPGWSTSDFNSVSTNYNVVIPFACEHAGNGTLRWTYGSTGVQAARAKGQKVILSTGGAGQGIAFSSRTVSQNFVNSFISIAATIGGVDGIDFNTFEADVAPNLVEYQWISQQLKAKYGPDFVVMSPPAPWSDRDKTFCKGMISSGAMDFCGPQFYDGPGLADTAYIVRVTKEWVAGVAGGDANRVIVGFGIGGTNYSTLAGCVDSFKQIKAAYPSIRGVFLWQRGADANGAGFGASLKPLVGSATAPAPTPTPTGPVVKAGTATFAYGGVNSVRDADELVGYTRTATQVATPTNQYGAEAAVVGGKVTLLNDRQLTDAVAGTPIPDGGIVLSGHGAARDWLLANAKVGAAVTVPGAPAPVPTPTPTPAAGLPTALASDASLATVVDSYNKLLGYLKGKQV